MKGAIRTRWNETSNQKLKQRSEDQRTTQLAKATTNQKTVGMNAVWMELVTQKDSVKCNIKFEKKSIIQPLPSILHLLHFHLGVQSRFLCKSNGISLLHLHYTTLKEIINIKM